MHIQDVSMRLESGSLNVLLGPTLSGKTSLMRLMAGLDRPSSGDIRVNGSSVVGVSVQKRDVAMVYQQFINYPTLTVYENIASPLRVARLDKKLIDSKVRAAADLLKLSDYLDRLPADLSGGQQQRTALARALVKGSKLVFLDEPLANLDYKLREELRQELPRVFAESGAVLVYASTEPSEALLLGGNTATMTEGRVTQFGRTIEVFQRPLNLRTAQIFSDPPLNTMAVQKRGSKLHANALEIPLAQSQQQLPDGNYTLALRPYHLALENNPNALLAVEACVLVTEITGSETFVHVSVGSQRWVALLHGVKNLEVGALITLYFDPDNFYLFDETGCLAAAPAKTAQQAPK
jgi:glycerol transport system ATP-binding protein